MDKEFPCVVVEKIIDQAALVAAGVVPAPAIEYARAPTASGAPQTVRLLAGQGSAR
jgi:hypothetical protein